jgi:NAD(P)-dependent dehydrogenase (short-subunit alcohol dehydrogenase family)
MGVAIVTGAGGGIGRAICLKLTELGNAVVLAGRTVSALEQTAAEVKRAGGEALIVPTDIARDEQVDRLIHTTMEMFGQINSLINNAGHAPMIPTADVTPVQWRQILDTNLSGTFYASRAVWPIMQRQHLEYVSDHRKKNQNASADETSKDRHLATGGTIVNISSVASRDPFPGLGVYAVAKVGVNMLTQVLAREGEPNGIRVMAVAPAAVETQMFRHLLTPDQVPAEDTLRPEDVADVVLACIKGSLAHSTGETIYVHRRM